jgi:metallo-beta-lactamase family protein
MNQWEEGVPYHKTFSLGKFRFTFKDSGHILGSAVTEFVYNGKKIVYTGDLGNSPSTLLRDTEVITDADYLIMESVYGDRNHETHNTSRALLEDAIEEVVRRNGVLMIPAFSIEKTQEILFEINKMMEKSKIPLIKVFLDSPLAIKVTEIYNRYKNYYNEQAIREYAFHPEDGIFAFPQLLQTLTTEESINIKTFSNPKVIIAGSGMSNGGRIMHHEKEYLPDKRSLLLVTGYQSVNTVGRLIQEGAKSVNIMGEEISVKATVVSLTGFSGHKGADDLLDFVSHTADQVKHIFVALGEPKSAMFLVQRIRDTLALDASIPQYGETVSLDI